MGRKRINVGDMVICKDDGKLGRVIDREEKGNGQCFGTLKVVYSDNTWNRKAIQHFISAKPIFRLYQGYKFTQVKPKETFDYKFMHFKKNDLWEIDFEKLIIFIGSGTKSFAVTTIAKSILSKFEKCYELSEAKNEKE